VSIEYNKFDIQVEKIEEVQRMSVRGHVHERDACMPTAQDLQRDACMPWLSPSFHPLQRRKNGLPLDGPMLENIGL